MPLDPNIILSSRPVQTQNPMALMQQMMMMRYLQQRGELGQMEAEKEGIDLNNQLALRSAASQSMTKDANGNPTLNTQAFLSNIQQSDPAALPQAQAAANQYTLGQLQYHVQAGQSLLQGAPLGSQFTPPQKQQWYSNMRQKAIQLGLPNAQNMPMSYPGDNFIVSMQNNLLSRTAQIQAGEKFAQQSYYAQRAAQASQQMATQATTNITNDPKIIQYQSNLNRVQNMQTLLQKAKAGNLTATSQVLGDLNNLYTGVLTGTNAPPLGKQQRAEYTTYSQRIAGLMQEFNKNPQSINSPAILNQIGAQIDALGTDNRKFLSDRIDEKRINYADPGAQAAQQNAISKVLGVYGPGAQTPMPTFGGAQGPAQSGMINIVLPDGRMGKIPQANLGHALQLGAKRL